MAELQRKKKSGKLTKEEKAELAREERRLNELQAPKGSKAGKAGGGGDSEAMAARLAALEAQHARAMEEEQARTSALMAKLMDPNVSEEEKRALMAGEKERHASQHIYLSFLHIPHPSSPLPALCSTSLPTPLPCLGTAYQSLPRYMLICSLHAPALVLTQERQAKAAGERKAKLERLERTAKGGKVSKAEMEAAEAEAVAVKARVADLQRRYGAPVASAPPIHVPLRACGLWPAIYRRVCWPRSCTINMR